MELISTGERLTTAQRSDIMLEHLHRYAIALQFAKKKKILDIASGEGYGSYLLAEVADQVIGVDISVEAIAHAQAKYQRNNLSFLSGSANAIPLPDHSIDLIVSFETIEHHSHHEDMMLEFKRVLSQTGLLIISSPDKRNYTDIPDYHNPFHVKELYKQEFKELICKHFKERKFLEQKKINASVIFSPDAHNEVLRYTGTYDKIAPGEPDTLIYNIALASQSPLGTVMASYFESPDIAIGPTNEDIIKKYTESTTWKLGRSVLRPILFLRSLFSK